MPPTQGQRRLRWSSGAVFLIGAFIILFIYHGFVGWYHATRSHAARAVAEQQAKGRAIPKLLLQQHGDQTIKDVPSAAAALDARLSAAAASRAAIRLAPPVTALNQPVPLPPGIKLPDSVLVALMTGHFFGKLLPGIMCPGAGTGCKQTMCFPPPCGTCAV